MTTGDYHERATALAALIDAHGLSSATNAALHDTLALPTQASRREWATISYSAVLEDLLVSNWSVLSTVPEDDDQRTCLGFNEFATDDPKVVAKVERDHLSRRDFLTVGSIGEGQFGSVRILRGPGTSLSDPRCRSTLYGPLWMVRCMR